MAEFYEGFGGDSPYETNYDPQTKKAKITKKSLPPPAPILSGGSGGVVAAIPMTSIFEELQDDLNLLKAEVQLLRKQNAVLAQYIYNELKDKK